MKTAKRYVVPYVDWNRESDKELMKYFQLCMCCAFCHFDRKLSEIMIYSQTLPHFSSKCLTFWSEWFPLCCE